MVTFVVDDSEIQAEEGTQLLKACLDSGIYIPNLCYMESIRPLPVSCRMCFVQIEGQEKPAAACTVPVNASLVVKTDTPAVRRLQKTALQLLLSVHDVDCKNCPANRKCGLQDIARFLKVGLKSKHLQHSLKEPPVDRTHPCLDYYPNRCVLCGKCIHVCLSHNHQSAITFARRGFDTVISFFGAAKPDAGACEGCQSCVAVCPVGALVLRDS
jgi:NADH dehydrogenase/NADH:ubiquinone oxidoreductase subunit G